jgi:hypothetical protein
MKFDLPGKEKGDKGVSEKFLKLPKPLQRRLPCSFVARQSVHEPVLYIVNPFLENLCDNVSRRETN